jgi:hypothetical protein
VPVLARGRHRDSTDGACLMEATALLSGQPFSDRPAGVHPLIADIARIVNDAVSDPARQQLLRFAPAAAATATDDPGAVDRVVIVVCERAVPVALPVWAPAIRHALRQARRRRAREPLTLTGWQRRRAAAAVRYATVSLALSSHIDRDQRLTTLLADCLAALCPTDQENEPVRGSHGLQNPGASPVPAAAHMVKAG